MKLRPRLALATVAVTIPVAVALFWFDAATQQRAAQQILTEVVLGRMAAERAACEASPASFGGQQPPRHGPPPDAHGRPPPPRDREPPRHERRHGAPGGGRPRRARPAVLHAYDEALRSHNLAAPAVPAALARAIEGHDVAVTSSAWPGIEVEVLVRMPWRTGPCAFVLAHGTTDPSWGAVLPESSLWLLPTVAVFLAMLVAVGPVVRRIGQLTDAVGRAASSAYAHPIAGGKLRGRDEIGALAAAFDAAGREIRAQLEARDRREEALRQFLANTTHDVMIPLTVLQGHLTTLRERAARAEPIDVRVLVSAMDEAHYMASLVHNLAAVARLEAAEVVLQPSAVDLGALVERVMGRHRPIARELEVAIESAVPATPIIVRADVTLLEQAVGNVTYNAIRYNRPGGHVAVILEPAGAQEFRLRVIDDGPGIPPDELSRIAERGFRGHEARTRAPDGQGLGLHIAYRAAEMHDFRLTLRPSEHGGLEVELAGARMQPGDQAAARAARSPALAAPIPASAAPAPARAAPVPACAAPVLACAAAAQACAADAPA